MGTDDFYQSKIAAWLRSEFGWSAATVSATTIERAIAQRQRLVSIPDVASYWQFLQTSEPELEALIELLAVPETWFFRDEKPFTLLTEAVLQDWFPRSEAVLRILSIPCSTGEEPYSIAMTLLDAGLAPERFHIEAMDVSPLAILKAQQGIYGSHSFRGTQLGFRDRYFQRQGAHYALSEAVKQTVQFTTENLLKPRLLLGRSPYAMIFCRNVLIYLESSAQQQVLHTLEPLLLEGGLLFLGCAETALVPPTQCTPVRSPGTFACRKQVSSRPHSKPRRWVPPTLAPAARVEPGRSPFPVPSVPVSVAPVSLLTTAQRLADQGNLPDAADRCHRHLAQHPTDVAAHVLLGQIYQAQGWELEAEQSFQKAVFLAPKHQEALVHLALLKEQQGDRGATERLWQRIQRLSS